MDTHRAPPAADPGRDLVNDPMSDPMRWDDLLEDLANKPSIDRDHDNLYDVLPTCCLTGILGAFGSFVVFGSVAVPVILAAAVGGLVGLLVARA